MKLTIELEDWQLDELKDALHIRPEHFKCATVGATDESEGVWQLNYAYRILRARKAIGLSVSYTDVTRPES